jgi:ABC-type antimicrobial peptide transport system permease subunit
MFISWEIYSNQIATQNLPGNGIDLMVRQATQTGNPMLDLFQSNWVNFSSIESIIDGTEGIEYYTTRMDYYSHTFDSVNFSFSIPVVGIHTNSFGNLKSDSVFGDHIILEKNDSYAGTTIEELLNISKNVCVVDENYANSQIANGNPSFGIGSNISIFPYETDPNARLLNTGMFNTSFIVGEGWLQSGNATDLTFSDDNNVTFISNEENLNITIDYNMTTLLTRAPKLVNLTIESRVNSTINQLDVYAYNIYTTMFDYLGDINTISEENITFSFGLNNSYISMTGGVKLRIMGHSLTPGVNFSVSIDNLEFQVLQSIHDMMNPLTWPTFEVVGIIKSPSFYNSEHYSWVSGFEYLSNSIENSIYINYEKARDLVYLDYKGESLINDKITSIIIKSSDPYDITSVQDDLEENLTASLGGTWTSSDISTFSLEMRNNAFTFYVWVENGLSEEDILTEIQGIIQDHGYIVLFGLTKPYLNSVFSTMINLMSYIMYGMLILSIIISLIGLALHCLLSTMSRRREIGMLRSIGLSKKGVVKTISGETLLVALLGVIIGITAGLILGIMMVSAMPTGGFLAVTLTIPWLTISILIVITIVAAIVSSRIPARWASNLNIIDAVRTR